VGQLAIKLLPKKSIPFRDEIAASASWRVLQHELVGHSGLLDCQYSRESHKSESLGFVGILVKRDKSVCNLSKP